MSAPAGASPAGTIVLTSGPSGTPTRIDVVDASNSYVLFEYGGNFFQPLQTVPVGGGIGTSLPSNLTSDYPRRLVGSLVTAIGFDEATSLPTLDFVQADGTGAGTVDVPTGYHWIRSAASADGWYVWSRNADKTIEIGDLTTAGVVVDVAALPNSAHASIRKATSDESGLVVAYRDDSCDVLAEDITFVPVVGSPRVLLHPASCTPQSASDLAVGGGNAAWSWYDDATSTESVKFSATSGGAIGSTTALNGFDLFDAFAVSAGQLASISFDDHLVTVPLSGGSATTSAYLATIDGSTGPNLASNDTDFVFGLVDSQSDSGIYTTPSAAVDPTKIFSGGVDNLAARNIALAPGQVAYQDNATPDNPVFTRSLTTSGGGLSAGPESLVTSSATGFGLALSGTRVAYEPALATLDLRSSDGAVKHVASLTSSPRFFGIKALSGRRLLYAANTPNGYALYNDVTGSSAAAPGPSQIDDAALWGNYLVTLSDDGVIRREDLAKGTASTIYTIPRSGTDDVFGRVFVWGNTVAWSSEVCGDSSGCTEKGAYLTVSPGAVPGTPTPLGSVFIAAMSNGYVAYLDGSTTDSPLVARPLAGGPLITLTDTPCGSALRLSLDDSTAAWLDCPDGYDAIFAPQGTAEAGPLPHVSNPPWFLGDPQAPGSYNTGSGTWDADFVTSAVLTSCSVVVSRDSSPVRTLPCDSAAMAFGEATASWDGTDSEGATVSPGIYTWTLDAANGDGSLRDYDGSVAQVTGTIAVDPTALPGAPTGVQGNPGDGQVTVSWSAPSEHGDSALVGYDVQYSADSGAHWTSASSAFHASLSTTQTVTGLTNDTPYIFRVAAINSSSLGAYSTPSAVVTPHGGGGGGPLPPPPGTTPTSPAPTTSPTPTTSPAPTTSPTETPASGVPTLATPPRVSGHIKVGGTVTCTATYSGADWQGTAWLLDGKRIRGHLSSSYTITASDFGHTLSCQSAARNEAGWTPVSVTSAERVRRGPALRAANSFMSGGSKVGARLTAHVSGWTPSASRVHYRWLRNGHVIPGATGRHYRLRQGDSGARIRVVVTATHHGYAQGRVALGPTTVS
ncbi:MAG TPA: fibronectin type III domain-containing protein [Mycobacteriales bacterium]|nr:fibronectin type III domain-containing protein [Mycobacteriales bacterium]